MNHEKNIGFLIFPGVTQLNVTIPAEILGRLDGYNLRMIWKSTSLLETDSGFSIPADTDFENCPDLHVLVVPGGIAVEDVKSDPEVRAFLHKKGKEVRYLASVCSGSLLLEAAGLLDDYDAASHSSGLEHSEQLGERPKADLIVVDGNRLTSEGISASLDLGLSLARLLESAGNAREIPLFIE